MRCQVSLIEMPLHTESSAGSKNLADLQAAGSCGMNGTMTLEQTLAVAGFRLFRKLE